MASEDPQRQSGTEIPKQEGPTSLKSLAHDALKQGGVVLGVLLIVVVLYVLLPALGFDPKSDEAMRTQLIEMKASAERNSFETRALISDQARQMSSIVDEMRREREAMLTKAEWRIWAAEFKAQNPEINVPPAGR